MNLECFPSSNGIPQLVPTSFFFLGVLANLIVLILMMYLLLLGVLLFQQCRSVRTCVGVEFHDSTVDFHMP